MTSSTIKAVSILLILSLCPQVFASSGPTHNLAARTAAQLAPEPFASNWEKCRGASHPDYMSEQPLGHENARVAGLLYTMAAIRHLRDGNIAKAMMTASARTHYVSDAVCVPHSRVWNPRKESDVVHFSHASWKVFTYLPARYQDYWLPTGDFVYGSHFYPLEIAPPPVHKDVWDKLPEQGLKGSMHGFFDRIPCSPWHTEGFPTEGIPKAENWSAYDYEFYARWRAQCITLDLLDRESAIDKTKPLKFVGEEEFKAVRDEEVRNMITTKIAYYRYLTVAANTELRGDIMDIFPSKDPLRLMVQRNPKILIGKYAPWPLKRAAYLFAMELVRAKYRYEGKYRDAFAENLFEEAEALFETVDLPYEEASQRLSISWMEKPDMVKTSTSLELKGNVIVTDRSDKHAGHIILHGEDLQSTIHLVDYLLDLTYAPLHGRSPVEVMLTIFEREWPGMKFLEKLDKVPDAEVFDHEDLLRPPKGHPDDREEWTEKVHMMVWPNVEGESSLAGPLPAIWDLFLLELPLPSGKKVDLD
ncbi:hypothetical protein ACFL1X_02535 [Candidatus Hydrogenedentota bacterium]